MPTTLTHALSGAAIGGLLAPGPAPAGYYGFCAALALLPDLDVVTFPLGIPYRSWCGHRGISHSLFLAMLAAFLAAPAGAALFGMPWLPLAGAFFAVLASHSLLDALTNGGCGVALLAPFDNRRWFFPWRPIQVSPIGLAVFSRWGFRALCSEVVWVWFPLAAALLGLAAARPFEASP
jgi:inner membrane protein